MALCLLVTYGLFFGGSSSVLAVLPTTLPSDFLSTGLERGSLILVLSALLTAVISAIAVPLGYGFMYIFGGIISTRAVRLYLFVTKGKHIVVPKSKSPGPNNEAEKTRIELKRQLVYWLFILSVVVSFVTYLAKRRIPIATPTNRASDVSGLITKDFVYLTLLGSLIIPVIALCLPYFSGLRLRSIDVGPFHKTVLTTTIGVSGGFSILYSILTRPEIRYFAFYVFLFMGVCWCFALGCNLAADPARERISRQVLTGKLDSRLLSSKIWLENPPGRLVEA